MKCAILCSVLLMLLIQATWGNCSSSSKPDFRAPESRISEEKCREYNWEKKCSCQDAEVNKHPYLGAAAFKGEDGELRFSSNAILISPKFAATTGHCTSILHGLTIDFVRFENKNLKDCSSSSKPDFRAPERRISEEKCREYNWEKKCSSQEGINKEGNLESWKAGKLSKLPHLRGAVAYKREDGELRFSCNAILISPKFAVTTGHCTSIYGLTIDFVRFGNKNLKDVPVIDAKVVKTIPHPQYAAPKYSFDIALLEFDSPLPVSRAVAPACLWSQPEIATNQNVQVSAWAETKDDSSIDILRTMTVQVIDSETCAPLIKSYHSRGFAKLEDHQLCVNESDTINYFYKGSAGAPIVTSVSLGDGDEMPYVQAFTNIGFSFGIGIYIKISSFVDWIEQTVWS